MYPVKLLPQRTAIIESWNVNSGRMLMNFTGEGLCLFLVPCLASERSEVQWSDFHSHAHSFTHYPGVVDAMVT